MANLQMIFPAINPRVNGFSIAMLNNQMVHIKFQFLLTLLSAFPPWWRSPPTTADTVPHVDVPLITERRASSMKCWQFRVPNCRQQTTTGIVGEICPWTLVVSIPSMKQFWRTESPHCRWLQNANTPKCSICYSLIGCKYLQMGRNKLLEKKDRGTELQWPKHIN